MGAANDLERMLNLGPISAARLQAVGVRTPDDLRRLGAVAAYVRLKRGFPVETTPIALYQLQGALEGIRWYEVPEPVRAALRAAAEQRL